MMRIFLIAVVTVIILIGAVGGIGYWKYNAALEQPLMITNEQTIIVPKGASPNAMFSLLEKKDIITDASFLRLYWRLEKKGHTIHAGEYLLKPGMDIKQLISIWLKGEVVLYKITLVDGWSFKQVRAALGKQEALKLITQEMTDQEIMDKLGVSDVHPEGQFFADTYVYMRGDTDLSILQQAHKRLVDELDDAWQNRADDLPYKTPYQALIMASIIEKETGVAEERPKIAGVFIRRLEKGMLLQTDPTVIYGMGDSYKGKITRADLKKETPYNTYVISGLPPTPIAMVSRKAIDAALHPEEGKFLYFVANGDGSHVFSESLTEHQRAVRKYQLNRRADYRSSPPPQELK
ncbi:endolytic transglycosylase MltG [Gammaproteobacteria bacterium ESL0073]|nr:endolytic transglycosylase MltG [Gammaproteobacteria bacterium ESL0073]